MNSYTLIFLLIAFTFASCNTNPEKTQITDEQASIWITEKGKTFPNKVSVDSMERTSFSQSLEATLKPEINNVYAATLGMAWNEIVGVINNPITKIESSDLKLLHNSKSYLNVLWEDEYKTSVEIEDSIIIAKAYFKKNLEFILPMKELDDSIHFDQKRLKTFGIYGSHEAARIAYYYSDDDFALKLIPKDENHEIILVMPNGEIANSFAEQFDKYTSRVKLAKEEKTDDNWRNYYLYKEDRVMIPEIRLNLYSNFPKIVGSRFHTEMTTRIVTICYQQNAFLLNHEGAKVESYAEMEATEEAIEEVIVHKPKNLIFNKPFFIFLKRKDNKNPYFAIYVANSEIF